MFETAVLTNGDTQKRVWAACLGVTSHVLLVMGAVLVPMMFPQILPRQALLQEIFLPTVPRGAGPERVEKPKAAATAARVDFQYRKGVITIPTTVPDRPVILSESPEVGISGPMIPGGTGGPDGVANFVDRIVDSVRLVPQPPAPPKPIAEPPKPAAASNPTRIRVSSLFGAKLVHRVMPIYPPVARAGHISGAVELVGVIGVDGRIRELRVQSGNPLLVPAALAAVREWIYEPTRLNGEPVEVIAPITVNFRLNE